MTQRANQYKCTSVYVLTRSVAKQEHAQRIHLRSSKRALAILCHIGEYRSSCFKFFVDHGAQLFLVPLYAFCRKDHSLHVDAPCRAPEPPTVSYEVIDVHILVIGDRVEEN